MDHCERVPEEADSVVSERCYKPTYSNDSRKWILRDGVSKSSTKQSTVKDSYRYQKPDSPVIVIIKPYLHPITENHDVKFNVIKDGNVCDAYRRRGKMIREKLLREAEFEVKGELNQPPIIEEYITTHDETYCSKIPGFVATSEIEKNPEMYEKYPLYTSPAMSYWHFTYEKSFGNKILIPGKTASTDVVNPFKRNARFSTPISELAGDVDYM